MARPVLFAAVVALALNACGGHTSGSGDAADESGSAAKIRTAGPHLSAVDLRRNRATATGREWTILLLRTAGPVSGPAEERSRISLGLGRDYFHVTDGARRLIYDFAVRRVLVLDTEKKRFENQSLFGHVASRGAGIARTSGLGRDEGGKRRRGGSPDPARPGVGALTGESDLGIAVPRSAGPEVETVEAADGVTLIYHDGAEVARFRVSGRRLPSSAVHSFQRFARHRLPLPLSVWDAIVAVGRVPVEISFLGGSGQGARRISLEVESIESGGRDYPLPAGFSNGLGGDGETGSNVRFFRRRLLPVMRLAVAGRYGEGPLTEATMASRIARSLETGPAFETALLSLDLLGMFPDAARRCRSADQATVRCAVIARGLARARRSARFKALMRGLALDRSGAHGSAIGIWRQIRRDDVASGHVIDRYIASAMTERLVGKGGLRQADDETLRRIRARYLAALRGNPYYPELYFDIGKYLAVTTFDYIAAWTIYDLGRALPGRAARGILSRIDSFERALPKRFPAYF